MLALSLIAMVDENYGVTISGEDLKNCTKISDLYELTNE
jgi:acyl carrier protein